MTELLGNKKVLVLLLLIFIVGYFLRVMYLPSNALTFGYDQARDALNALQIVGGHLKVFGPPASAPGLFHGVLYYYVLAPFYLLSGGNPIGAAYGIAFINALTIFVVFVLTYLLTGKNKVSLIAALLYAISFEATQYATWLSNPTLGIITVPVMYLGLWLWIRAGKKKKLAVIIAAVGLGLSIQAEIFLAYHALPLLVWLWLARKNITKKEIMIFVGVLFLTTLSMFLAQLKFGIEGTVGGIRELAVSQSGNLAYQKSIGDYLVLYLNQVGRIFSFNSYPGNVGWGGGFVLGLIFYSFITRIKNIKNGNPDPFVFVSIWLISHLSVVSVGGTSTPFLMVGIGPAVSILIALFVGVWIEKKYQIFVVGVLMVLSVGNITMIVNQNKNGATLFSIQKDMVLSKELAAITYTYEQAGWGKSSLGEEFSVNSVTSPLWVNIVWTYLYKWYGQEKYGYIPTWHGRGQEGQIDSLVSDNNVWKKGFLIIEPQDGIPTRYLPETISQEDYFSDLASEEYFGAVRVQERERNDK